MMFSPQVVSMRRFRQQRQSDKKSVFNVLVSSRDTGRFVWRLFAMTELERHLSVAADLSQRRLIKAALCSVNCHPT
jgi:hypothetical protein